VPWSIPIDETSSLEGEYPLAINVFLEEAYQIKNTGENWLERLFKAVLAATPWRSFELSSQVSFPIPYHRPLVPIVNSNK
jgi:hypothetical protein